MRIDVLTLFPEMFHGPFDVSMIKRAIDGGLVSIHLHNIRDYALDKHHVTDDYSYGGGPGMVMKPEPIFAAAEAALALGEPAPPERTAIVLMTPQGRLFHQRIAEELAAYDRIMLICGHYEGVDDRVREHLATDELSIGDYVLTGGELPAMVVIDAVVRRIPGVLGCQASGVEESITSGLLEYPQYTRPAQFRGWSVPDILLSGHHAAVDRWRREQSLLRTAARRPDLLAQAPLTAADRKFLTSIYGTEGLARLLAGQLLLEQSEPRTDSSS